MQVTLHRRVTLWVHGFHTLWKEGDGNQRLELVKRDWLDCFREIMRNPEFKKHFDLIFRPVFDAAGGRLIGQRVQAFGGSAYRKNWGQMLLLAQHSCTLTRRLKKSAIQPLCR